MHTIESFFRGAPILHKPAALSAELYNLSRILLSRAENGAVFVPIRAMQYLAVIDREEIIFVDAIRSRSTVVLAWRHFDPRVRLSITDPVSYEIYTYVAHTTEVALRLPGEFRRAMLQLKDKQRPNATAEVLPLRRTPTPSGTTSA